MTNVQKENSAVKIIRWMDIKGYPEYRISNIGTVKLKGQPQRIFTDAKGYKYIYLSKYRNGKLVNRHSVGIAIHRLVFCHFSDEVHTPRNHIHHINGNKTDNRIENLRQMSPSEHIKLHHDQGAQKE